MSGLIIPESAHATALKQVWMHEYPDTVLEDRSCISTITGHALPTDIVNHKLKVAIEVQSAFHDIEQQKIKDAIKRKFWIDSGYNFYAIDHRDYTIIEMIQIFFDYIMEIPDYVDFTLKSIRVVQLDLDKNFIKEYDSIESAEHAIGCASGNIGCVLKAGKNYCHGFYWLYKEDYESGHYDITSTILRPIIQLDGDGNFIAEYKSIADASRITRIKEDNIRGCKKRGRTYSGGYHWIYKDDYISGNYELYKGNPRNNPVPIVCLDKNKRFITRYGSIKEASNATGVKSGNIRQCIYRRNFYSGGYYWIKEDDYLNKDNIAI